MLQSSENNMQVLAQFYGLPLASLRAAAWRHMLEEGRHGFDVSTSCCSARHATPLFVSISTPVIYHLFR
jgi:hypothetical protein